MIRKNAITGLLLSTLLGTAGLTGCVQEGNEQVSNNASVVSAGQQGQSTAANLPQKINPDRLYPANQMVEFNGAEYTLQRAQLLPTSEQAGISSQQLLPIDPIIDQNGTVIEQDPAKLHFLLCDITVKNVDADIMDISMFSVVYAPSDQSTIVSMGLPAYFSHPKNSDAPYQYRLGKGQSMEVQIAWLVDAEHFPSADLYLALNFAQPDDQSATKFIPLGL